MIRVSVHRFGVVHTLLLEGLLAIGLVASTAFPALGSGTFHTTGSMNVARESHTATLLSNGQVLAAGGDGSSAELYNPATGRWTLTGNMNVPRSNHQAVLLQNGQVLVAGGLNAGGTLASAELYNPSTGTWAMTGSMTTARYFHTATLLPNGTVLITGGITIWGAPPQTTSSAEIYKP